MIAGDFVYGPSSYSSSYLTADIVAGGNGIKEEDNNPRPTVYPHQIVPGSIIAGGVKEIPTIVTLKKCFSANDQSLYKYQSTAYIGGGRRGRQSQSPRKGDGRRVRQQQGLPVGDPHDGRPFPTRGDRQD